MKKNNNRYKINNKKMESDNPEFTSYKKLLIFGGKEVGKSTLVKKMEKNKYEDNYISSKRKIYFI